MNFQSKNKSSTVAFNIPENKNPSEKRIFQYSTISIIGICTIGYFYYFINLTDVKRYLTNYEMEAYSIRYLIALVIIGLFGKDEEGRNSKISAGDLLLLLLSTFLSLFISIHCDTESNKYLWTSGLKNATFSTTTMIFIYMVYIFSHYLGLCFIASLFGNLRPLLREKRYIVVLFTIVYVFCHGNISNYFFFSYFPQRSFNDIFYILTSLNILIPSFIAFLISENNMFDTVINVVVSLAAGALISCLSYFLSWRTFPYNYNDILVLNILQWISNH